MARHRSKPSRGNRCTCPQNRKSCAPVYRRTRDRSPMRLIGGRVPDQRGTHRPRARALRASNGNSKIAFRQCQRRLGLQAMSRKWNHWGYYVMATRESAYPPSWRWRIIRRGKSIGVRIEGGGFSTYEASRRAGSRALTEFLEQLELESFRID